jgi:hypothetical protein
LPPPWLINGGIPGRRRLASLIDSFTQQIRVRKRKPEMMTRFALAVLAHVVPTFALGYV